MTDPTPAPPAGPVLGEEARAIVRAVTQGSSIMTSSGNWATLIVAALQSHVAALVAAAEQRGAAVARADERERVAKRIEADMDDWLGDDDGYNLYRANAMVRCMETARQAPAS